MRPFIARTGMWLVVVAGTIIAAQWECGYGEVIGMGHWSWLLPVVTDGYLWTAMATRRDVAAALAVSLISMSVGAARHTVTIPPVLLALSTATLLVIVMWRGHLMLEAAELADEVEEEPDRSQRYDRPADAMPPDVATAVTTAPVHDRPAVRPVVTALPRPVTTAPASDRDRPSVTARVADEPGEGRGGRGKWDDVTAAFLAAVEHGRAAAEDREHLAAMMRAVDPRVTSSAVRSLHNRLLREVAA